MKSNDTFKVKLEKSERKYVRVYHDLLENQQLSATEKLVYICLKAFVDFSHDSGQLFPSVQTLCRMASMSKPTVIQTIDKLIEKQLVKKIRRGKTKTNVYILRDTMDVWPPEKEKQEVNHDELSRISTEMLLEELERRGCRVREEEPEAVPTKNQLQAHNAINQTFRYQDTASQEKSQVYDKKSMQDIKEKFDYDVLIYDYPNDIAMINSVFNILYNTINTDKPLLRVSRMDVPANEVKKRLNKLTHYEIAFVIQKYNEQTNKIYCSDSYILTQLFNAEDQLNMDIQNRINANRTHT